MKDLLKALYELRSDETLGERLDNEKTEVDVVDPYLFPYIWGRTRTLSSKSTTLESCISRCGEGEVVRPPPADQCEERNFNNYRNEVAWSNQFQWLPFDVNFSIGDATRYAVHIASC